MRLSFFAYIVFFFCTAAAIPCVHAQKEINDSIPAKLPGGVGVAADEVYFNAVKAKMLDDNKTAADLFEQFITLKPDVSDPYYELAAIYADDKKTDKAEEYIKKAIALDGNNKWYKEEHASILAGRGDYDQAAAVISALAKSEPEDPNYPVIAADYYKRAGKNEQAIEYLDKAIARNGIDEDILMSKMQLYLTMNKVDKAAGVIEQLILQDNKNGKYYKLLAELYDNNKMPAKATAVFERAQKIIPGDPYIEFGMAAHFLNMGDTASYTTYIKKAIVNKDFDAEAQLDLLSVYFQSLPNNDSVLRAQGMPIIATLVAQHPDDAKVLTFYGELLEINNQRDSAIIEYKKSLNIDPSPFKVWEKLLGSYTDPREADSLIKYSAKAIRLFPNQATAHFYNGIGHLNKKEYQPAIKAILRAIDMEPAANTAILASMYATLAEIYHNNSQDDLSDDAFDKALQLDPDNASLLNNYSYYLSERGKKLADAERMSRKSLMIRPGEATFMDTYGWILYKNGNYPKAKEYILKAIELAGQNADATLYDHLGNVYFKLNDKDKALQYWKTARDKGDADPKIDKKIKEGILIE